MFWIILGLVCSLVTFFLLAWFDYEEMIPITVFGCFFIFFLIGCTVSCCYYDSLPEEERYVVEVVEEGNLVSLKDSATVSGNFFLGSGSVSSDLSFRSYVLDDDGFIVLKEFNDDVKFTYTDGEPCYRTIKRDGKPSFWLLSFVVRDRETVVYIPNGSVVSDYVLDLQ